MTSKKGLVSKIYKELLKLNNLIKNGEKNSHFSQEDLISKLKMFIVIGLVIVLKPNISHFFHSENSGFSKTQG